VKRLFIVATGQDTTGWGYRIQAGFGRQDRGWSVRSTAATIRYQAYPRDLPFKRPLVRQEYHAADVIQLRNTLHGWHYFDEGDGKPTVVLYHGTHYRAHHAELRAEAERVGAVQIVSTLDLTLLEGDTTWVGSPYSLTELRAIRAANYQPYQRSEVIRIAHAPTDRKIKGTEHFLAVCERLRKRHPIELVLIENRTWAECLRRKATADIFYDQLELGYGGNAVEAWGMGIPVVAGVADPKVRAAMRQRWGRLPFRQTTPDTLERRLEALITSEQTRREWAEIGGEHFARFHDERVVISQLADIYESAKPTRPGAARARSRDQQRERFRRAVAARDRSRAYQAALTAASSR
jgi:hypothetical protein